MDSVERFIKIDDVVVRYSHFGVGEETVVLLHGYGASLEVWDDFAGQLGKKYRVITLDLPGSGFSTYGDREEISMVFMAEVTCALLQRLEVANYHLIGHSMGGAVAVALAGMSPTQIKTLTLFHSLPVGSSIKGRSSTQREIELIASGKKEMLTTINPNKGFAEANVHKCADAIEEKLEQFMLTDDEALIATLKGLLNCPDRTEVLQQCTYPVLFVFGDSDPYISLEVLDVIGERLPSAQVVTIANSAHHAFIEKRDEVLEVVDVHFLSVE